MILVEALQFVLMNGSCDIDDILLNGIGAVAAFLILKIGFINNFMKKIYVFE